MPVFHCTHKKLLPHDQTKSTLFQFKTVTTLSISISLGNKVSIFLISHLYIHWKGHNKVSPVFSSPGWAIPICFSGAEFQSSSLLCGPPLDLLSPNVARISCKVNFKAFFVKNKNVCAHWLLVSQRLHYTSRTFHYQFVLHEFKDMVFKFVGFNQNYCCSLDNHSKTTSVHPPATSIIRANIPHEQKLSHPWQHI